ncbi:unnamed protein product [Paramecium pentaurelia]|uniref:Uncharacterized protein n=1 Tax=Paramecium pentaurelia TaxID=43138 RepID=A0A8S1XS39_9CILI|nr:unnamed protein product [Paramecium pentaurelia]
MQTQPNQLNTPSTQFTLRTPEKNVITTPHQIQSDIYTNTPIDSRRMIIFPQQSNNYLLGTLIPYQDVYVDTHNPIQKQPTLSMANIEENLKIITQKYQEISNQLKVENQERIDIENKFQQLQSQNKELKEELIKQKQICKQMENFSKELQQKLQNQVTMISSHSSIENQNQQNDVRQKEIEIIELKQQLDNEKLKSSNESDRLMTRFNIIFQEQKNLNQKLLQENIDLQKILRQIDNNQKISQKSTSNLLDESQLKTLVEQFYFDNNEECLLNIPNEQQLQAIKILKLISTSQNQNQQNPPIKQKEEGKTESKLNIKQELKEKQEQLIAEIKNKMGKFIEQKNVQQKDIMKFQNESEELKRQLNQIENLIFEMEQSPKHNPNKNSCVSFENNNFY